MEQRILGDYRIIKSIGQGTLGTVYLAEHRFMKRQYALKVLPEELASDRGFIQRFEEDVSLLASIDHPHIVKIYNISFAQGQYFLVTDCIVDDFGEPTNLAKYVMGLHRPLEEEELYEILRKIAGALDYAHTKKVGSRDFIHRCLKPNNILVGKRKQEVDIYLSDFGLSRIIGSGAVLSRAYKNVAEALGIAQQLMQKSGQDRYPNPPIEQQKLTPLHTSFLQNYAFLAPEQKRLDMPHVIDAKADVYAFGVLVYFLLMNELPEGLFDLPSSRDGFRYQWDPLIIACLQAHPNKRPDHLIGALEAVRIEKTIVFLEEPRKIPEIVQQPVVKEEKPAELTLKYLAAKSVEIPAFAVQKAEISSSSIIDRQTAPASIIEAAPVLDPLEDTHTRLEMPAPTLRPNLQTSQLERPQTDPDPGAIFQVNSSVKTYNPERKDVTNVKPLLTDMVIIPGELLSGKSRWKSR